MATDKINLSGRNSDDDTFSKKESSYIKKENSMEETNSLSGDSSSCLLSAMEIKYCLESPHIKDNFTDINNIGAGGFGSVYETVHRIEKRKYALKFLKMFSLDFDSSEVEILVSLDHPNVLRYCTSWVIPLHKCNSCSKGSGNENSDIVSFREKISSSENNSAMGSTKSKSRSGYSSEEFYDACLVIQTELCNPSKNLKILIDEGEIFTMSEEKRLNLFLDIVFGLQYIHRKGIMHRDLKPSNIFIDKNNRAKIGDFGFARTYKISPVDKKSENGSFSQHVGTNLYIAPEVENSTVYDNKADIYSLGMILFEMFHEMGSDMERNQTMGRLRNQEFKDLSNIPAQFSNIPLLVRSLLSHDPSLRETLEMIIALISLLKQQLKTEEVEFLLMEYLRVHKPICMREPYHSTWNGLRCISNESVKFGSQRYTAFLSQMTRHQLRGFNQNLGSSYRPTFEG